MAQTTVNTENNKARNWQRMAQLINKDGEVWLWDANDFNREGVFVCCFTTKEDAQEYARLKNETRTQLGHEAITFSMGTMDDYCKACEAAARLKRANEVKAYQEHVSTELKRIKHEIKALETLKDVCKEFDGKVINKRFHDAVKDRTGFYNHFSSYAYELNCYEGYEHNHGPRIYMQANWTGRNDRPSDWRYNTNDRMEAGHACAVIDCNIIQRNKRIEALEATTKKYREYLQKARKAEALIKELEAYDYEIRDWAKEHDLSRYNHASYIWK